MEDKEIYAANSAAVVVAAAAGITAGAGDADAGAATAVAVAAVAAAAGATAVANVQAYGPFRHAGMPPLLPEALNNDKGWVGSIW